MWVCFYHDFKWLSDSTTKLTLSFTSGNSKHPHDTDDGWIDRDDISLHFFQDDTDYGQQHDENVQLIPSEGVTKFQGKWNYSYIIQILC